MTERRTQRREATRGSVRREVEGVDRAHNPRRRPPRNPAKKKPGFWWFFTLHGKLFSHENRPPPCKFLGFWWFLLCSHCHFFAKQKKNRSFFKEKKTWGRSV